MSCVENLSVSIVYTLAFVSLQEYHHGCHNLIVINHILQHITRTEEWY